MTRIILDSTDLEELGRRLPSPTASERAAFAGTGASGEGGSTSHPSPALLQLLKDVERALAPQHAGTFLIFTSLRNRIREAIAELEGK